MVGKNKSKSGVSKGEQMVLVSDIHRIRPRVYLHVHKSYDKFSRWTWMN